MRTSERGTTSHTPRPSHPRRPLVPKAWLGTSRPLESTTNFLPNHFSRLIVVSRLGAARSTPVLEAIMGVGGGRRARRQWGLNLHKKQTSRLLRDMREGRRRRGARVQRTGEVGATPQLPRQTVDEPMEPSPAVRLPAASPPRLPSPERDLRSSGEAAEEKGEPPAAPTAAPSSVHGAVQVGVPDAGL